jgi:ribosome biogenesis GTPase A
MNSYLNNPQLKSLMKKGYWTLVKDIIKKSDVVLEVLDARFTALTRIEELERFVSSCNKPLIFVINKADIVSEATIASIRKHYLDCDYVIISSKFSRGIHDLVIRIKTRTKMENARVAVIGYPNTGKSSLINRLSRNGKALTSSESGFTKGLQLIIGRGNLRLFDTPGVVPFQDRDETRLGLVSGISPSKLKDPDIVAYGLIEIFIKNNPSELEKVYGLDTKLSPEDLLTEFGKKSNMLMKHGLIDEKRAAIQLLNDWHKGKIML